MLVALIDIFVIKLFSYDLKDHTFILQTPASTTPFRLYNIVLLRDVFHIGLVIDPRPAVLA
jgi:hypothetical protein